MTHSRLATLFLPVTLMAAGLVAIVFLNSTIELRRPPLPRDLADADLDLRGSGLKGFAFGMEGLIADWYYMRSLQYIGDKLVKSSEKRVNLDDLSYLNPRLLYPLLDMATDLDPHFLAAYDYGAVVLPAIDPEKAIALASKGIENNPREVRLYQQLGYVFWRLERYAEAAETYETGAAIPGASPVLRLMAANMRSDGTSRESKKAVYREMLANSTDEAIIEMAERHLRKLGAEDQHDAIDSILTDFQTRYARCVNDIREITPQLLRAKLPDGLEFSVDAANRLVDSAGMRIVLNQQNCRVMR